MHRPVWKEFSEVLLWKFARRWETLRTASERRPERKWRAWVVYGSAIGAGFTRRSFLKALSASAAYLALVGAQRCAPRVWWPLPSDSPKAQKGVWTFRSRPDLGPAAAEVARRARDTAPGYVFAGHQGGRRGARPDDRRRQRTDSVGWQARAARDFKVQHYQGARCSPGGRALWSRAMASAST